MRSPKEQQSTILNYRRCSKTRLQALETLGHPASSFVQGHSQIKGVPSNPEQVRLKKRQVTNTPTKECKQQQVYNCDWVRGSSQYHQRNCLYPSKLSPEHLPVCGGRCWQPGGQVLVTDMTHIPTSVTAGELVSLWGLENAGHQGYSRLLGNSLLLDWKNRGGGAKREGNRHNEKKSECFLW